MVAITILLAVATALVAFPLRRTRERQMTSAAQDELDAMLSAVEAFRAVNYRFPDRVEIGPDARPVLTLGGRTFTLAARGLHQADNAVRVWAVAEALGLDLDHVAGALERFALPAGRGELLQVGGLTILNDCYNANPQSFRAAIATARSLREGRPLVFVAGTMRELGAESEAWHRRVAFELVDLGPDLLAAVGEFVPADRVGVLPSPVLSNRIVAAATTTTDITTAGITTAFCFHHGKPPTDIGGTATVGRPSGGTDGWPLGRGG
jgi:UDP-N-acetylmuramoyl-tripeptide--D-alanyl-D-alanine ligase